MQCISAEDIRAYFMECTYAKNTCLREINVNCKVGLFATLLNTCTLCISKRATNVLNVCPRSDVNRDK